MSGRTPNEALGFLNDLKDWESSLKDNNNNNNNNTDKKKMKMKKPLKSNKVSSSKTSVPNFDFLRDYQTTRYSLPPEDEDTTVDANSEKDLGNEFFKQKKYNEAIDCYSRSIAFSPTAIAFANRAMAYLKIRRFREAEEDCTEALNLDDRYIKAYSRRTTARKELKRYKEAIDDAEFALRLEPDNQEIKKQLAEVKSLYEKEILQKASSVLRSSVQETQKAVTLDTKANLGARPLSNSIERTGVSLVKENNASVPSIEIVGQTSMEAEEVDNKTKTSSKTKGVEVNGSRKDAKTNHRNKKQELKPSIQELASRAASLAKAEAAKNIRAPTSAYEFEVSWRGFFGDRELQASLLKVTSPSALPQIFNNALSAPMLVDIIKCVTTFFTEEMDLAVKYLENLTKVPRFSILVMCLSSTEKADLLKLWNDVFCNVATPMEYTEILENLRTKYFLM